MLAASVSRASASQEKPLGSAGRQSNGKCRQSNYRGLEARWHWGHRSEQAACPGDAQMSTSRWQLQPALKHIYLIVLGAAASGQPRAGENSYLEDHQTRRCQSPFPLIQPRDKPEGAVKRAERSLQPRRVDDEGRNPL